MKTRSQTRAARALRADFQFQNHGTLWLCRPNTTRAIAYLAQRCPPHSTDHTYFGGCLVVEPHYGITLVTALRRRGFVCGG